MRKEKNKNFQPGVRFVVHYIIEQEGSRGWMPIGCSYVEINYAKAWLMAMRHARPERHLRLTKRTIRTTVEVFKELIDIPEMLPDTTAEVFP